MKVLLLIGAMASLLGLIDEVRAQVKAPRLADATTGPIGPDSPGCRWGAVCVDPVRGETIWFGGTGGVSRIGGLRTWVFANGHWQELTFGTEAEKTRHKQAIDLAERARDFYARVANRYYQPDSRIAQAEGKNLISEATELRRLLGLLAKEPLADGTPWLPGDVARNYEEIQAQLSSGELTRKQVAAARRAWLGIVRLAEAIDAQPSLRCNSAVAYEPQTKQVVLFGGEGVHGAYADTWLFDTSKRTWRRTTPPLAPSPRMGHGMIGHGGKVYLVGGQEPRGSMSYGAALWQRLPMDVWEFDVKTERWRRIQAESKKPTPNLAQPAVVVALADGGKKLTWAAPVMSYGKKINVLTGECSLVNPADAGTKEAAVSPNVSHVRGEGFDPAWYENVPEPDTAAIAAKLKNLPENQWIDMKPPRLHVQRDWGTVVFDPERDQFLHWGGGHSSHCGTEVAHYSIALNRWYILQSPEMPFEYCYSNDGAPVPSMTGYPWSPHSYLSYALDPRTKMMIWTGTHAAYRMTNPGGTFRYDRARYRWSWPEMKVKGGILDPERHRTCMVPTPQGIVVWAGRTVNSAGGKSGLWRADLENNVYEPIVATDARGPNLLPPIAYGDRHGITYDSKRKRVLLFHFGVADKHRITACDLQAKEVSILEPKHGEHFPKDASIAREATYVPDLDWVVICSQAGKERLTLVYDCAANAWLRLPGLIAVSKSGRATPNYGVSWGVEWDAKRKLLWGIDEHGNVYALRLTRSAKVLPLSSP